MCLYACQGVGACDYDCVGICLYVLCNFVCHYCEHEIAAV